MKAKNRKLSAEAIRKIRAEYSGDEIGPTYLRDLQPHELQVLTAQIIPKEGHYTHRVISRATIFSDDDSISADVSLIERTPKKGGPPQYTTLLQQVDDLFNQHNVRAKVEDFWWESQPGYAVDTYMLWLMSAMAAISGEKALDTFINETCKKGYRL